jgi:hypothetical protein
MIDPIFPLIAVIAFAAFWMVSALKKVTHLNWFKGVLEGYGLFPKLSIVPLMFLVPATEFLIGGTFLLARNIGMYMSASLLLVYALVLTFNALRGHVIADCGCSWGGQDTQAPVSPYLYGVRNVIIALLGAVVLIPQTNRSLGVMDGVNIGFACVACVGMGFALSAVLKNRARMRRHYHA